MALGLSSRRLMERFFRMGSSSTVTLFIDPFSLSKYGLMLSSETTCLDFVAMLTFLQRG